MRKSHKQFNNDIKVSDSTIVDETFKKWLIKKCFLQIEGFFHKKYDWNETIIFGSE